MRTAFDAVESATIWVYRYRFWDPVAKQMVVAPRMATAEVIRDGLGVLMPEAGMAVRHDHVTDAGIYQPPGVEKDAASQSLTNDAAQPRP